MKFSLIPILMLLPGLAFAAYPKPEDIKFELNTSPYGEHVKLGTQLVGKTSHWIQLLYDFNRQGGDTATKYLLDASDLRTAVLPAGAIVKGCVIHVLTPITSPGSPTIALSTGQSVDDLKGQTAKSALATPDALVACDLSGSSVASWQKLGGYTDAYSSGYTAGYLNPYSREYTPTIKIKGGAITGGKLKIWIEYLINR